MANSQTRSRFSILRRWNSVQGPKPREYSYTPNDTVPLNSPTARRKRRGPTESELPDHQDRSSCRVHSISTEKGQLASSPSCSTRGYEPYETGRHYGCHRRHSCQSAGWPETGSSWQQWHTAPCRDLCRQPVLFKFTRTTTEMSQLKLHQSQPKHFYPNVSISSPDLHQKKLLLSSSESWCDHQLSHQELVGV